MYMYNSGLHAWEPPGLSSADVATVSSAFDIFSLSTKKLSLWVFFV